MEAFEFSLADDGENLLAKGIRDFAETDLQDLQHVFAHGLGLPLDPAFGVLVRLDAGGQARFASVKS